jgi:hypothetical protein
MATQIQIQSTNYNGQLARITFYPCSGGTIDLGYQTIPYIYTNDNYQGTYDLYFSAFSKNCPLVIPCITPTPTLTPTPTSTPTSLNRTLGLITSCGGDLTGSVFSINYNSVNYPISTLYDSTTLSGTIPVIYPAPGVVYDFTINVDGGFTLCSVGSSFGVYDRIKTTVGTSAGVNLWNCVVEYYSGSTLVYSDSGDLVSVSSSSGYGQTWNVNITFATGGPTFQVTGKQLADQLNNNLTTENDDLLEIQS